MKRKLLGANNHRSLVQGLLAGSALVMAMLMTGCATKSGPTTPPAAEPPAETAPQERTQQIQAQLSKAKKLYEAGSYNEAMQEYLLAIDSDLLSVPQQLEARKYLAFIHCVNSRLPLCSEQFQKAFVISEQFDLSPAEAGHPIWGPVFRSVKTDVEQRRTGQRPSAPAKQPSPSETASNDGMTAYQAGNYAKAITNFKEALTDKAMTVENQIIALKFTAFSYCLTQRVKQCRAEFASILRLDPTFELSAAEIGHPNWGAAFRAEKARLKSPPAKK